MHTKTFIFPDIIYSQLVISSYICNIHRLWIPLLNPSRHSYRPMCHAPRSILHFRRRQIYLAYMCLRLFFSMLPKSCKIISCFLNKILQFWLLICENKSKYFFFRKSLIFPLEIFVFRVIFATKNKNKNKQIKQTNKQAKKTNKK